MNIQVRFKLGPMFITLVTAGLEGHGPPSFISYYDRIDYRRRRREGLASYFLSLYYDSMDYAASTNLNGMFIIRITGLCNKNP